MNMFGQVEVYYRHTCLTTFLNHALMGRPQLHKTEEARLEAARRSNRKYYAKYVSCTNSRLHADERRNRREIGLKMAMSYRHKRDNTTKSKRRNLASAPIDPKCVL